MWRTTIFKEIQIKFDLQSIVEKNLVPKAFAQIVQDANVIYQGSSLKDGEKEHPIQFDTKIQNLAQLEKLPIKLNQGYASLSDFAEIAFADSKQKEIVRINGEEVIAVQIKSSSNANIMRTTSECKKLLSGSGIPSEHYKIISDKGETQRQLLKQVLSSLAQSFILVMMIIPFFYFHLEIWNYRHILEY